MESVWTENLFNMSVLSQTKHLSSRPLSLSKKVMLFHCCFLFYNIKNTSFYFLINVFRPMWIPLCGICIENHHSGKKRDIRTAQGPPIIPNSYQKHFPAVDTNKLHNKCFLLYEWHCIVREQLLHYRRCSYLKFSQKRAISA